MEKIVAQNGNSYGTLVKTQFATQIIARSDGVISGKFLEGVVQNILEANVEANVVFNF